MSLALEEPAHNSEVEFCDPNQPFTAKPLIADILRTRYCIPGSVFLVERIDDAIPVRNRYHVVRLLLGDGDLCIQTLLSPQMHGFVDGGQIYAGCYVRVDKFELRVRAVARPGQEWEEDDVARHEARSEAEARPGREKDKPTTMVYLLAWDLATVGWNTAYMNILGEPMGDSRPANGVEESQQKSLQQDVQPIASPRLAPMAPEGSAKAADFFDDDVLDDDFEQMEVSIPKATQKRRELEQTWRPMRQRIHAAGQQHQGITAQPPWTSSDPAQPVKLTPLRSIPNLPKKQNWTVNVLAVLASLSDLEPSHLPPHQKRTARLADPSTSKHVLLTVFLDPEHFTPEVGSVVLLLGVKNHRFDGGSLNKYATDRLPKGGTRWWFENPCELEWCDVAGLHRWWQASPKS